MASYPSDWDQRRKSVYRRDNFTCQNCGRKGGPHGNAELHAHHIVPKSKGGSHKQSNLVTICKDCHNAIHTQSVAPSSTMRGSNDVEEVQQILSLLGDISKEWGLFTVNEWPKFRQSLNYLVENPDEKGINEYTETRDDIIVNLFKLQQKSQRARKKLDKIDQSSIPSEKRELWPEIKEKATEALSAQEQTIKLQIDVITATDDFFESAASVKPTFNSEEAGRIQEKSQELSNQLQETGEKYDEMNKTIINNLESGNGSNSYEERKRQLKEKLESSERISEKDIQNTLEEDNIKNDRIIDDVVEEFSKCPICNRNIVEDDVSITKIPSLDNIIQITCEGCESVYSSKLADFDSESNQTEWEFSEGDWKKVRIGTKKTLQEWNELSNEESFPNEGVELSNFWYRLNQFFIFLPFGVFILFFVSFASASNSSLVFKIGFPIFLLSSLISAIGFPYSVSKDMKELQDKTGIFSEKSTILIAIYLVLTGGLYYIYYLYKRYGI